jgi:hypothetical protein
VQLHHFDAELGCGIHLFQRGINKQTNANPGNLQPPDGRLEFFALRNDIEAAFSGNFLTLFRDETDFLRLNAQRNVDNAFGIAHLEIQFRHDILTKALDVSVLNVTAITAKMRNDSAGASPLAEPRSDKCIGLCIPGFRHCGISRLPQCRYVIDIHSQTQTAHGAK